MRILACVIAYICSVVSLNDICPENIPKSVNLTHHGDYCYEFVLNRQATWSKAQEDCMTKNGSLLDIQSSFEDHFIFSYFFVVRLTVPVEIGVWIGLKYSPNDTWQWNSSVSTMYYKHWDQGQPENGNGENCGLMENSGLWHNYPCDENYSWICKYRKEVARYSLITVRPVCKHNFYFISNFKETTAVRSNIWVPMTGAVVNDKCPTHLDKNENLRQFGHYCYRFILKEKKIWYDARENCKKSGGTLVKVHNSVDQDFVTRSWQDLRYQDENDSRLWIDVTNSLYIDIPNMSRKKRKEAYQNWAPDQDLVPNFYSCPQMDIYGKWYVGCSGLHGFICKYSIRE